MKTPKLPVLLVFLLTLIFAGCEKNELTETKEKGNLLPPTEEEIALAKSTLPVIDGWNNEVSADVDFSLLKSGGVGQYFQVVGQYWDEGTFSVHGNLYVTGCVSTGYSIKVVYWLYNYSTKKWKNAQEVTGQCMDEDNLNMFHTYYSDVNSSDANVIIAAQIYIENPSGTVSLWDTFWSNIVLLDWPF